MRVLIVSRKNSLANCLTDPPIPTEASLKAIAEVLNIKLNMFEISGEDVQKSTYGKGAMEINLGY